MNRLAMIVGFLVLAHPPAFGQVSDTPIDAKLWDGKFWDGLPLWASWAIWACIFVAFFAAAALARTWFNKPSGGKLITSVATADDQLWLSRVLPVVRVRRNVALRLPWRKRDELITLFPGQLVILRKRRAATVDQAFEPGGGSELGHAKGARVKRTLPLELVTEVSIEHANWLNQVRIRFHQGGKVLRVRVLERELPNLARALQLLLPGRVATGCRITYHSGVTGIAVLALLLLTSLSIPLVLTGYTFGLLLLVFFLLSVLFAAGLILGHIPKVHIFPKPQWWGGNKPRTAEDLSNRRPLRSRSLSVAAKTVAAVLLFAYIFNYMDLEPLKVIQPTVDGDVTSSGGSSSWWKGIFGYSGAASIVVYFLFASIVQIANSLWQKDPARLRVGRSNEPILYLRSFLDDRETTLNTGTVWAYILGLDPPIYYIRAYEDTPLYPPLRFLILRFGNFHPLQLLKLFFNRQLDSSEQQMAAFFRHYGTFVAIGKPGERFATTGALRMYVSNDEWQTTVEELLRESLIVVLQPASTEGIWWEVERSIREVPPERLLLCMVNYHNRQNDYETFRLRLEKFLPASVNAPRGLGCKNYITFLRFENNWQIAELPQINYSRFLWLFKNKSVNLRRTLKPFLVADRIIDQKGHALPRASSAPAITGMTARLDAASAPPTSAALSRPAG